MKEMSPEDRQRIEKEAQEYLNNLDEALSDDEIYFVRIAHIDGATAEHERMAELLKEERNKGMEIAIKRLENEIEGWLFVYPNPQPQSPASYGIDSLNQAIRNIRELDMKSK